MPQPGLVTPPQAGGCVMHTTKENITKFFDAERYKGKGSNASKKKDAFVAQKMDTCRENIEHFFNPERYRSVQKRPSESPGAAPAPKARLAAKPTMSKDELLSKFKLAAELNGLSWDELIDSGSVL